MLKCQVSGNAKVISSNLTETGLMTGKKAESQKWQLAISLLSTWRREHRLSAVAKRLAEVAARDGPAAVEQAALGLTEVAGMLLEVYADYAGTPLDSALEEVAAALKADPDISIPDA